MQIPELNTLFRSIHPGDILVRGGYDMNFSFAEVGIIGFTHLAQKGAQQRKIYEKQNIKFFHQNQILLGFTTGKKQVFCTNNIALISV
jgi:hypothetical protein